ncbi:MAG: 30S ribosome-binding factor RbfA [Candidatus Omnitrophica bacterium]|nr:30S ribosome-binding factor RbfA [Candidatus Omnitrophota bacterium]MBU2266317.1 30S ribosome-binding factor RbfA [Candidatus Omnitrophota bacterium]MBU2473660.1 30S ribosome-binding factor RbfA [Candidatus Omnitrophota bacterium]
MNKVDQELRKRITEVIQQEIDDPAMDFLSVTRVKTTTDLQESKVYYSLLDDSQYEKAQILLDKMRGFIRSSLGKRIHLKIIPQLRFIPDETIKYSVDVYKKLEDLKKLEGTDEN